MKTLLLCACLLTAHGGDREKGLQCYREGRYAEAAAAFRAAIASEGDSADLQFNLALASWRAGDLAAAETAVEKYAAMAGDARTELHAGLLGALRHEEAKLREAEADALIANSGQPTVVPNGAPNAPPAPPGDPMPLLEQALQKASQSQDYFLRGVKAKATPELLRNVERSLRTIEEIEKKIEELKKQRKEQKQDEKKDEDKKPEDKKPDEKNEPDKDQKKPDEKPDEKQDPEQQGKGEEKPEPKAGEPQEQKGDEQKAQPKAEESKSGDKPPSEQPDPKPGEDQKARTDAPGEAAEGKELTPEQTQRLLEQLENLDAKMKSFRARAKTGRRPVERDW